MAGLTEALQILITANGGQAVAEFGKIGNTAETQLGRAQSSADKLGSTMTKVGAAAIGLGAVMVGGAYMAAKASEEQTLANTKLENTLRNMPKLAGESAKQFQDQASALQKVTVASDEEIISAQAMLGTFNLTASQMRDMMPLIVDYARKFDTDLVTASKQVGKALDGNVGALKRNGVSIDEAMFKTDRYRAVTEALGRQVKGFAEAEGKTFSGQLAIMKNQLGEIAEGVGVGAVSAFSKLLAPIRSVSDAFQGLSPGAQSAVGSVLAFGGAGLIVAGGITVVVGQLIRMREAFQALQAAMLTSNGAMAGVAASLAVIGAIGAVTFWNSLTNTIKPSTEAVNSFTEALKSQTGAINDNVNAVFAKQIADAKLGPILDKAGVSMEEYVTALRAGSDPARQLVERMLQGRDAAELSEAETIKLLNATGLLANGYSAGSRAAADQTAATNALSGANTTAAGSAEAAAQAATRQANAMKEAAADIKALTDPIFAATRAQQQQQAANDAVVKSYLDYTAAINQYGAGSMEAVTAADALSAAQQRAGEAGFNTYGALLKLNEAIASGAVTADQFKVELDTLVASGVITQQTADAMSASFYGAAVQAAGFAGQIQGVTAATQEAVTWLQALQDMAGRINRGEIDVGLSGSFSAEARAAGGPVDSGQSYLVGETGPELFVPATSGRIIPNGTAAAGDVNHFNIYGSADPRQTAWEIIRARRAQTFLAGAA